MRIKKQKRKADRLMKKSGYLVIAGLLFCQPLLVSATEVNESNNQVNVEITEPQGENSLVSTSESEETEQTDTTENEIQVTKKENTTKENNEQEVKAGSEQTDKYDWDQETGTLTVKKGEFERDYINAVDVNKIIFRKGVTFPDDSSNLFSKYVFLQAIEGLENIDSSNVINMQNMFSNLPNLKNLDVSCLNTSNVTNMSKMFSKSRNLINLNVSGFDTTNVTDMSYMFSELENLSSLDVSSFDTANVVYMNAYMNHLTNLDINNFVTTKVIDMHDMFYDMPLLKSLDVSALNTSRVTDMHDMFSYLGATKLNLANFDTSNVTNMRRMFAYSDLTALDLSNFNTSNVTDMTLMFSWMDRLKFLDISNFNTSNRLSMNYMFLASDFLSTIVLGEMTKLNSSIYLETLKEGPEYTGNWSYIKDANGNKPSNPLSLSDDELMNYDGTYPGTYVWEKKQGQPVTIQYVDKDGKNLAEATELTGPLGEPYEAQAKEIEGYLLDKEQLPENRTGTFTNQKQTVTFIYKKAPVKAGDVTVRYEDEEGNELSEAIVMSGNVGDS
jgi:surface protein